MCIRKSPAAAYQLEGMLKAESCQNLCLVTFTLEKSHGKRLQLGFRLGLGFRKPHSPELLAHCSCKGPAKASVRRRETNFKVIVTDGIKGSTKPFMLGRDNSEAFCASYSKGAITMVLFTRIRYSLNSAYQYMWISAICSQNPSLVKFCSQYIHGGCRMQYRNTIAIWGFFFLISPPSCFA